MNPSDNVEFTKRLKTKKIHRSITLGTNTLITIHCFIRLNTWRILIIIT